MSKKNKKEIQEKTPEEIIKECGKLGFPKSYAVRILCDKISSEELERIKSALGNPNSIESQWYEDGIAIGDMELAGAQFDSAVGNEKDAYKSMSAERKRQAVDRAIRKNFGIDDEE